MATSTKKLREDRAKLIADARAYHDQHADDWNDERQAHFDKQLAAADALKTRADQLERLDTAEAGLNTPAANPLPPTAPADRPPIGRDRDEERLVVRSYLRDNHGLPRYVEEKPGHRGSRDYREKFASYLRTGKRAAPLEIAGEGGGPYAALQSDSDTQAGYLVASEEFAAGLLKQVDDLLFIRRYATVHTVREAGSLGIRKRTAVANTFAWTQELTLATADSSLAYGKKVLTPHHATGEIRVSRDLLRRSTMSIEMIVAEELARDAGELMEDGFLSGSGSQQPLGVFTASADGISTGQDVSTGNTSTAITADGLINAKYALKSQYRNQMMGAVRWLFHRTAVKQIALLKDGDGQYLWKPGITEGQPDMLLGYPLDESERSPSTFTSGLYVGLLANWRYYEIADALDIEIQRVNELYAATNQVGFIARLKTDGMPTLEEAFVRVKLG